MSDVYSITHPPISPRSLWRHKKRGTTYEVAHSVMGQGGAIEGVMLVVYHDGERWYARPTAEFLDGRFERVDR